MLEIQSVDDLVSLRVWTMFHKISCISEEPPLQMYQQQDEKTSQKQT